MNAILQDVKPVVWVKWKNREPDIAPLKRSGHTLTQFQGKMVLFGGTVNGLEDPNIKKLARQMTCGSSIFSKKICMDGKK